MKKSTIGKGLAVLTAAAFLSVPLLVVAPSTVPAQTGDEIFACFPNDGGRVRFVSASSDCTSTETGVSWNVQGPKGETGLTGDKGDKGDTGLTGDKGDKGDKGDTGDTGAIGAKGDKGDTGAIGGTGAKGDKGDKGDIGATGPAGPQGIQAPEGPQGLPGNLQLAGSICPPEEFVIGLDLLGNLLCAPIGGGAEGPDVTLYDDFDLFFIDPIKWIIRDNSGPSSSCQIGVLEESLTPPDGALITALTLGGENLNCRLDFVNPDAITGWSTDLTVSSYTRDSGRIEARIAGTFFRASLFDPVVGTVFGDIFVQIRVRNFEPDEFEPELLVGSALFIITFCANPGCIVGLRTLSSATLGNINLNETRNIAMDWDGQTTFTFELSGAPPVTVDLEPLGVTNLGLPDLKNKQVGSRGRSNPIGQMTAIYDNVRCHTVALPACPF